MIKGILDKNILNFRKKPILIPMDDYGTIMEVFKIKKCGCLQ